MLEVFSYYDGSSRGTLRGEAGLEKRPVDKIWNTAYTKGKISMVYHGITTLLTPSNTGRSLNVVSRSNDATYQETRSLMNAKVRRTAIER